METFGRYQTHRKNKIYGYKTIGLITTISKHYIRERKLIIFDYLRRSNLEEIVWVEKIEDIVVC